MLPVSEAVPALRSIAERAGFYLAIALAHLVFISASAGASDGYSIVESFSAEETGIAAKTWATVQDSFGVLHFGGKGLVSFDGNEWRISPMKDAFALRGLDFAGNDKLWAAAVGEIGWFARTPEGWEYHSLRDFIPTEHQNFGQAFHAFADGDGAVFVTENKILRWNGRSFRVWEMAAERGLRAVRFENTIFVHHKATGLFALRETGPELVVPAAKIGNASVFWLERRGARWLFVTSAGLFEYANGELRDVAPETNAAIKKGTLTSVIDLGDGRLALGTYATGVLLVDREGRLLSALGKKEGLPTSEIYSLFLDRERQLWATSSAHIFRVALNSSTTVFDGRAGLSAKPIHHLLVHQGEILAVDNEGIHRLEPDTRQFSVYQRLTHHVAAIRSIPSWGLMATTPGHLKRLSNVSASSIYSSAKDIFVIQPSRLRPGNLLFSENRSVKRLSADGTLTVLADELPDIATSIAEDETGHLWLGTTAQGVLLATPGSAAVSIQSPLVSGERIQSGPATTFATKNGDLFVFSTKGAWIKFRHAAAFKKIPNFPSGEILGISESENSTGVWLAMARAAGRGVAVGQIALSQNEASWRPHAVDGIERAGSVRTFFAETGKDSTVILWIGGSAGIVRNLVLSGPTAPQPNPPVLRTRIRSTGTSTAHSVRGPIPYSTTSIQFEFAAPQFANRAGLRLETRIHGIDADWVPADPSARRELTAVRDGRYKFEVRAVADTGVASKATVFHFEVLPPWWRTTPVIVCGLLALLPLSYGTYRLRVRALRRRNTELEIKVRERTEQLEAASAAKTQFVANMSHDIRNPLNGIVGLALALEDTRLDTRQQEIVATLRECTTYLSSLVDDVLDFASIEAGRVELRPGPFVPQELLRSIVETLKADTAESGAVLSVHVGPGLPANLLGDAGRIQQILVNFVSNALKYAGGPIRLSVRTPPNSPDEVEFAVTDEGPGISAEEQATLFVKFSRLKPTRGGEEIPGAGLGLAACRLLADIMGGSVGVESRPGHGARFFLRLPLTIATAPVVTPAANLPNSTVLLVEDADYNAWAASAVLARLGLSCERARTGEEALRLFGEKRFNVVLLDRNLPDMDGTDVARRMREMEPDGRQAVLLAVTAYCTADDRALCLQAGMDAFVGKPLTPEKLRKVLLDAGRRQLAAASVQVSQEPPAAELDLEMLTFLSDGSTAGLNTQIQRFLDVVDEAEAQIVTAWNARDFVALTTNAHRLVGHVRMVGATALAEAAAHLVAAARSRDGSACSEGLARVRDEIQAITEAMRHRRPAAQPT